MTDSKTTGRIEYAMSENCDIVDNDNSDIDKHYVPDSDTSSDSSDDENFKVKSPPKVTQLPLMISYITQLMLTFLQVRKWLKLLRRCEFKIRKFLYHRDEMKKKKNQGEEYVTRHGKMKPAKSFTPLITCCREKFMKE